MHAVAKSLTLLPVVLLASACGLFEPSAADPHAVEAVMLNHAEPPRACSYLGEVTGDVIIGDLAAAHRDLVKNAADGGGNYVAVDETERHPGGYGVRGRLFRCPSHIPAMMPAPAAPVMAACPAPIAPAPIAPAPIAVVASAPPVIAPAPAAPPTIAATPAPVAQPAVQIAPAPIAKVLPIVASPEPGKIAPAAKIAPAPAPRQTLAEDN